MINYFKSFLLFYFFSTICYSNDQFTDSNFFYAKSSGKEIMNPENYPKEITEFLEDEKKLVIKNLSINNYDSLLEIGCAESVRAKEIVKQGYKYFGIDINKEFIKNSKLYLNKEKLTEQAFVDDISFFELDSSHIFLQKKCLILFPFNLFGNLEEEQTLNHLFTLRKDFIIVTYTFDEKAEKIRGNYYNNCQYTNVKFIKNDNFSTFTSDEGLHSTSYNQNFLKNMIVEKAKLFRLLSTIEITLQSFNDIGLAILVKFL